MGLRIRELAPDQILTGGNLITMDPQHPSASAAAIKDGRFIAVGADAEVSALAGRHTTVTNLESRTVVPGIIDPHNHMLRMGRMILSVRLHGTRSIREIQERVAERARAVPSGTWIIGQGWDETLLAEARFPTRWDLDEVAPDHPVVLNRTWNKLVANSLALKLCGIDRNTPDPPADQPYAGAILRNENGEPTGVLTDRAKSLILHRMPLGDQDHDRALQAACQAYNRLGITGIVDPGLRPEEMRAYHRLRLEGGLTVRSSVCVGAWGHTSLRAEEEPGLLDRIHGIGLYSGAGDARLRLDAVKMMPDGGGSDSTAFLYEPYANNPANRGTAIVDPEQIPALIWFSHQRGWSVDAHCCGDRMQDIVVEAMAQAMQRMPTDRIRHRIHHAYLPTERSLDLMREYRIAAITQPVFMYSQGDSYLPTLGPERTHRLMPARTYLERGVPLAFSSDAPVADFNPWLGIYAALTRRSLNGTEFDQAESVTRAEALRAYTADAAWITFEESVKGAIVPGMLADLAVLDRDLLTCPVAAIPEIRPVGTMVGGDWVFRE